MQMTSEQFQALGDWIMKEAAYMVCGSNRIELEASNARKKARQLFVEESPAEPLKIGDRVRLGEPFDEMGMGNGWTVAKIYSHEGLVTVEHPSIGPAMVSAKTVTKVT